MQDIKCAVPPVPWSPTFVTDGAQKNQVADLTDEDETTPKLQGLRLALEQEVANLKEKLTHEVKLREALERGLQRSQGTLPKIPGYIPPKMRELLFEVAVLEEEVTFLEKHAVFLRQELHDEKEPASSPHTQVNDQEQTLSMKPPTLKIDIPEIAEPPTSAQYSVPVLPMTVSSKHSPCTWGPSVAPSPVLRHEGHVPLPVRPSLALPLPMPFPPPLHADESISLPPPASNTKRVIRRGSSSSESLPTDLGEQSNVVVKPSKKKPNHKKSASLTSASMKSDFGGDAGFAKPCPVRKDVDRGDVYQRLSAPKNGGCLRGSPLPSPPANHVNPGYGTLRRSTSLKELQGKHLSLSSPFSPALLDDKGKDSIRRPTSKKELHGRSPPAASPQSENKGVAFLRRAFNSKEVQAGSPPVSNPTPKFEDKGIASVKRTVSRSPHCGSLPSNPIPEKEIRGRLVAPLKLPSAMATASDEQQSPHDLVISKSLPRIQLTKAPPPNKIPSDKRDLQQRQTSGKDGEKNSVSENARLYTLVNARPKLPVTPTKQGFNIHVQKATSKLGGRQPTASRLQDKLLASANKLGGGHFHDDDKGDKVGMVCRPMLDAPWLSEDVVRLLGTICSKIRWPNSVADSVTSRMVAKPPVPLLGSSQKVQQLQRSESFDLRSSGGLRLLQEYCSDDMDLSASYGVHKNGRTEDVGPHRHYYKSIRQPLVQRLKA